MRSSTRSTPTASSLDAVRATRCRAATATALLGALEQGREARRNLPSGARVTGPLVELRIPVPDRPAVLAEVTTMAGRLGVNIVDIEIAHSIEGDGGVLVLVVSTERRRPRSRRRSSTRATT